MYQNHAELIDRIDSEKQRALLAKHEGKSPPYNYWCSGGGNHAAHSLESGTPITICWDHRTWLELLP